MIDLNNTIVSFEAVKAYMDELNACADYSQKHSSCALKDNPHYAETNKLARRAFTTQNVILFCAHCNTSIKIVEKVDDLIMTRCPESGQLFPIKLDVSAKVADKLSIF